MQTGDTGWLDDGGFASFDAEDEPQQSSKHDRHSERAGILAALNAGQTGATTRRMAKKAADTDQHSVSSDEGEESDSSMERELARGRSTTSNAAVKQWQRQPPQLLPLHLRVVIGSAEIQIDGNNTKQLSNITVSAKQLQATSKAVTTEVVCKQYTDSKQEYAKTLLERERQLEFVQKVTSETLQKWLLLLDKKTQQDSGLKSLQRAVRTAAECLSDAGDQGFAVLLLNNTAKKVVRAVKSSSSKSVDLDCDSGAVLPFSEHTVRGLAKVPSLQTAVAPHKNSVKGEQFYEYTVCVGTVKVADQQQPRKKRKLNCSGGDCSTQ
jgi:hypothetical protein